LDQVVGVALALREPKRVRILLVRRVSKGAVPEHLAELFGVVIDILGGLALTGGVTYSKDVFLGAFAEGIVLASRPPRVTLGRLHRHTLHLPVGVVL